MAGKKVLIIESDKSFAKSLGSIFTDYQGVKVKLVGDGKEGLREAKENTPNLILLSVELPKMSGYSICKKLKNEKQLKSIPLVIMSSEATEETFERHRKLKTRAEEYIVKPFDADTLLKKISTLIDLEAREVKDSDLIMIEDEESIVIDDLPDLDDDSVRLVDDDATLVKGNPLESGKMDDLEEFDDVLGDLEAPGELESSEMELSELESSDLELGEMDSGDMASIGEDAIIREAEEIEGFDEVLDSLKEVEEVGEAQIVDLEPAAEAEGVIEQDQIDESPDIPSFDAEVDLAVAPIETAQQQEEDLLSDMGLDEKEELAIEPEETVSAKPPSEVMPADDEPPASPPSRPSRVASSDQVPDPALASKLRSLDEENQTLRQKLAALEQRLNDTHRTYEKRESELGSLRTKATSKDKEYLALKATINSKDREILDLKEETTRKDQELLEIQEKSAESEQELYRLRKLTASQQQEIKESSGRVENLLGQKAKLEKAHWAKLTEWEEHFNTETAKLEHQIQVMTEEHQKALRSLEEQNTKLQTELKEIQQRHGDETFSMRNKHKEEVDRLENEVQNIRQQIEDTHNLEAELETARKRLSELEEEKASHEQSVVKAYQKIKADEKIKDKARKAVEIALTLLADQVSVDELSDQGEDISISDSDEVHT